ncbi:hypothetical protein Gpo141_00002535 [Globisporangium polare]
MIFTSPYESLAIPQDKTLWDFLELHARGSENAHAPAFICSVSERQVSFSQMLAQAQQVCAGLHARGIRKGDVVIVHSINCIEYPVVFLALNRLGAICSPSSPMFNAHELYDQASLAKAKAIISNKVLAQVAVDAAKLARIDPTHVYTMAPAPEVHLDLVSMEDLIAQDLPMPDLPRIDPQSVISLPFSSGTTGRPKGVEQTAQGLLAGAINFHHLDQPGKYTLGLLPLFHIMSTMLFHSCVYSGKAMVVIPRFFPDKFLAVLEKYKLEKAFIAPPLVLFLAQNPMVDNYDLSHLKELACGGAPLGVEIESMTEKRLGVKIIQGYGMTELSGAGTFSTADSKRPGSVGKLVPSTLLKVKCLTTGKPLPPNERGELVFKTNSLMKGYLNNPEANEVAFCKDGFLHTGDIGYIDDDGFVFIVDRIKELIKYKGHQVAPAELEDVLNNHPSVADSCCVRGFEFATSEEIPKAYVVLKHAPEDGTMQSILDFVASKVAPFKKVREVEFIDVIPKSVSGKILRRELQVKEDAKIEAKRAQLHRESSHP